MCSYGGFWCQWVKTAKIVYHEIYIVFPLCFNHEILLKTSESAKINVTMFRIHKVVPYAL